MSYENRYTDNLKKVERVAKECAVRFQVTYVGTEQLIYAILKIRDCLACEILTRDGITLDDYARVLVNSIDRNNRTIGYTPRAKSIFEKAVEYSLTDAPSMTLTGTEHLLYAILCDVECIAYKLLAALGANIAKIKRELELTIFDAEDDAEPDVGTFEIFFKTPGAGFKKAGSAPFGNANSAAAKGQSGSPLSDVKFGIDLTQRARDGKLDPVIGRKKEIDKIIQVLSRRTKNNPVLIGEPGVGKSAVVEGLAQAIVKGEVPDLLKDKIVFSLDLSGMLAGAKYRGDFEERLKNTVEQIQASGNVIMFIDEIHTIVGAGSSSDSNIDAANILKPMLARGELQTIGATTIEEYRKYIEKDAALERRFTPVQVDQPTVEDTIEILKGLRDKYEAHHKVTITDEAIEAAATLSDRYITDRFLPDKAIDLIDEAASRARLDCYKGPQGVKELEDKMERLNIEKQKAAKRDDYTKAQEYLLEIKQCQNEIDRIKDGWKNDINATSPTIGKNEVASIVSGWTGIPVVKMTEEESRKLLHLEDDLHKRIVGQESAVTAVAKAIRRARAGLKEPNKPIGSFIFVGPTGVGKTDLCKSLAESMFGDEKLMIRLDMSEYMEKHTVSKLIGAPPGYVGFDDSTGQLTEKVRRKPYSVILFDEIEKAHPDVFNVLLQILDDGRLTDSKGRTIDFKNTIVIMTSNLGASAVSKRSALGFGTGSNSDYEDMRGQMLDALKKNFKPEFLNRVDDIIVFSKLSKDDIKLICDKLLAALSERLSVRDIKIKLSAEAEAKLVDEGYDEVYGARPLKRTIQRRIEDRLSEEILAGTVKDGDEVYIDVKDGDYVFKPKK